MFAQFNIGLIEIEVALVHEREWNGPGNDAIRTTVSAVIEGQHVTYSVSEIVSDYATYQEMQAQFDAACAKYQFTNR
jgi:NADPH-dependent curcumin reductase CurA